jgi:hypothetical protein
VLTRLRHRYRGSRSSKELDCCLFLLSLSSSEGGPHAVFYSSALGFPTRTRSAPPLPCSLLGKERTGASHAKLLPLPRGRQEEEAAGEASDPAILR